jgi:chromosome segregation ATPase
MLSLDQIQLVQQKVEKVIAKINMLEQENAKLISQNNELIKQNNELNTKISSFEADQSKIEQGLLHALERLNSVENSVLKAGSEQIQSQQKENEISKTNIIPEEKTESANDVSAKQNIAAAVSTLDDSGTLPEINEIPEAQTENVSTEEFGITFEEPQTNVNSVNTSEKKPYDIF